MTTNRIIKFRGKSEEAGGWVYGSYMYSDNNKNNPFGQLIREKHQILAYFPGDWNLGGWSDVDVDPETVGQFTGMCDKNGKEIYEGDKLKLTIPDGSERIFVVKFGKTERVCKVLDGFDEEPSWPIEINGWAFEWEGFDLIPSVIDDIPDYKRMEVIGNIYDK